MLPHGNQCGYFSPYWFRAGDNLVMINLFDDVPTFLAVVEAGSFAAAAKRLRVSRSAVGKAVARIEQRLGSRLFQRTTRSQSLTDEGQIFFERCGRAMAELEDARAMIEAGHAGVTGKLRVSMPVLYGRLRVAPVLLQLARSHPRLEIDLDFRDYFVDVIRDGFDLCVRGGWGEDIGGLMSRRIAGEATIVCASPAYIERNGAPSDLVDLARHETIAYRRGGKIQVWRFPNGGRILDIVPSTRFHVDDLGTILDSALAGFGLAWLPDWLIDEHMRSGRLVRILPNQLALTSDFYVVWPETPYLPRRVRVAIDALAAMDQPGSDRSTSPVLDHLR
jgi:DNA-binding transcriptional LysR family regulator